MIYKRDAWIEMAEKLKKFGAYNVKYDPTLSGKIVSNVIAAYSQYHTVSRTTGITIGTPGNPVTIVSLSLDTNYNNLIPLTVKATPAGLGSSESATFIVVAILNDNSNPPLATRTTAAASVATETFTIADFDFSKIPNNKRITKILLLAYSTATSTSATATGSITALENYV